MTHGPSSHETGHHDSTTVIGTLAERNGAAQFTIERGFSYELVDQLIEKSKQPHIKKNCHRDADERFVSPDSFGAWSEKGGGRTTYFLTGENGDLAGLIWYGKASLSDGITLEGVDPKDYPAHTFAIRMYEGYEGRGLARNFMLETTRDYIGGLEFYGQLGDFHGIHLETDTTNERSQPLYHKVGYEDVHTDLESGRVTMVLSPDRINELRSSVA